MRKGVVLFLIVALAALAIVPVFAQDAPGTIAEIVVAAASAETPEFTALLAAVSAADPAVLTALSDPMASLTVFAPTDAAFAALGEETLNAVLADQALLTSILTFHVVPGIVPSDAVLSTLEAGEGLFTAPTLNGQYIDITQTEDGIFINGATLVLEMIDIQASNGVIHVIDAVILPETRTLAEVVVDAAGDMEAPQFTALLAAVGAADPAVLEALSNPEASLTVFAPTDEAFAALGEETLTTVLGDQELVTGILLYHVVDGAVYSLDVVNLLTGDMGETEGEATPEAMMPMPFDVTMLSGQMATISLSEDGDVFINEAQIIRTDIDAANGVIHVIDAVILPAE